MDIERQVIIDLQKSNWFVNRVKKYPIITFIFAFLLVFRLSLISIGYYVDKEMFLKTTGDLGIWTFIIIILIGYPLEWLLVAWVASKLPQEKLKQKFFEHPITTIIFATWYLILTIPNRLTASYTGGFIFKIINIFEALIYDAFQIFLLWLLICWISSKIFKQPRLQWLWYKKLINKLFVGLPVIFKVVLGLIIAVFIFFFLFMLISVIFKYSGKDLIKLFLK